MKSVVVVAVLVLAGVVQGDPVWIGGSGNWSDAKNWQGGVLPVETDTVHVSNTVGNLTVNIDLPSVTVKSIHFEGHSVTSDVTVTGGKLVLTSSEYTMAAWSGNAKRWDLSKAALIAYPNGVDFHVPVEFTSAGMAGIMSTFRDLHFRKAVTALNATTFKFHNGSNGDYFRYVPDMSDYGSSVYFHDAFRAPKANVTPTQAPTRHLNFLGPVFEADKLQFEDYTLTYFRLMSTNTIVHSGVISPAFSGRIESENANTYPTNTIFYFRKTASSKNDFDASVDLGNVDRTIDRLKSDWLDKRDSATAFEIRSHQHRQCGLQGRCDLRTAPVTLTLRGTGDAVTETIIRDNITVVWDPVGDFTQTFSNRTHRTLGSFVVKGGKMKLGRAGSFATGRSLEVAAGAAFELESEIADPLPRDLVVSSTAKVKLNGATVHVKRLVVDGVAQPDATYTGEDWMDGAGSIVVAAGDCCSWIGTAGGNWGDTANWLGGRVPSSSADIAVLDAGTAENITIAMNADIAAANFPGRLEILNRGVGTTTLRVTARVTDMDGRVFVGRHACVDVPTGGLFYYETAAGSRPTNDAGYQTFHATPVFSIVDGGKWRTCGGTTVVTNFCGEFWVNGEGSRLEISDGLLLHTGWGSEFPIMVGSGACLSQTGGEFLQPHEGFNNCGDLSAWGGTIDFSGGTYDSTVQYVGKGTSSYGHSSGTDFGFGTVKIRGTSVAKLANPVQSRTMFWGTWLDWSVCDNVRFYNRVYMIVGRPYIDATLHIYDTPKYMGNWSDGCGDYALGAHYNEGDNSGSGRLWVHPGAFLRAGVRGVWAAGGSTNMKYNPTYQHGDVRVDADGFLYVHGSTHEGYGAGQGPNGIRVGGCARTTRKSGRPYTGRMDVFGNVTNRINLVIGGWFGQGTYVQAGGETMTCTAQSAVEHGLTALGMAGGEGALLVSNGCFTSQQSVWVGGCFTNDFVVAGNESGTTGRLYPNKFVSEGCPTDNHGAEGFLEVVGGDFRTTKSLYVGADGTGVVSVVGSAGSFQVAQNLVLSNQSASVARFTADAAGVKPIVVGGRLVLTDASSLDVDLTACAEARRVKLFTATGGVEGVFGSVSITPLDKRELVRRGNDLYVVNRIGSVIVVR